VRAIQQAIRSYRVKEILEIAPGPGRLSFHVTGFEKGWLCDVNTEMLAVARERLMKAYQNGRRSSRDGLWQIIEGDAFNLPFEQTFDMIYTFRFIRHFELPERELLYRQVHSHLKPGGVFLFDAVNQIVAAPIRDKSDESSYPIYDVLYAKKELIDEIKKQGFEIISLTPVMRHMKPQHQIQVYLGPRSNKIAKWLIQLLEFLPGEPLEWNVLCRKKASV
jgi:SAM-dependent methyltransferase